MPGATPNYGWSKPLGTDLASTGDEVISAGLDAADAALKAEEVARIAHANATTGVHGILDTAALVTTAALNAHAATPHSTDISGLVTLTTAQTITGIKTFSADPVFNDAAIPVAKISGLTSALSNYVTLDTAQAITGLKTITPSALGAVGLIVKGVAAQTADLQQWQDSAGTVRSYVNSLGAFGADRGVYATGPVNNSTTFGHLHAEGGTATSIKVIAKGAAAQTADLQQWKNSAGGVLAKVNPSGRGTFTGIDSTSYVYVQPESTSGLGLIVRGLAGQTADLQQWQNSGGSVLAQIYSNGSANFASNVNVSGAAPYLQLGSAVLQFTTDLLVANKGTLIYTGSPAQSVLIVKGAASQTADLQQWQDSAGAVLASITPAGSVKSGAATFRDEGSMVVIEGRGMIQLPDIIRAGPYFSNAATVNVNTTAAARVGLVVRGVTGQTADLQQWQNSAAGVMAKVTSDGTLFVQSPLYGSTNITVGTSSNEGAITSTGALRLVAGGDIKFVGGNANGQSAARITGFRGESDITHNHPTDAALGLYNNSASGLSLKVGTSVGAITGTWGANGSITQTLLTASVVGHIVKGAASQTANLQEWQNSTGAVLAKVDATGNVNATAFQNVRTDIGGAGGSLIIAGAATSVGLNVRGFAAQTGDLQQWQDSAGVVLAKVNSTGFPTFGTNAKATLISYAANLFDIAFEGAAGSSGLADIRWENRSAGFKMGDGLPELQFGAPGNPALVANRERVFVTSRAATLVPLTVKSKASQTADLQQWQDSAATVLVKVIASGDLVFNRGVSARGVTLSGALFGSDYYQGLSGVGDATLVLSQDTGTVGLRTGYAIRLQIANNGNININSPVVPSTVTAVGLVVKGAVSQTADLQQWQNSAGAVLAQVNVSGGFQGSYVHDLAATRPYIDLGAAWTDAIGPIARSAAHVPWRVKGAGSQTADLQQWQNSAGTVLARIDSTGGIYSHLGGAGSGYAHLDPYGRLYLNPENSGALAASALDATLAVGSRGSSTPNVVVRSRAAQTADLQQWQNSAGLVLANITAAGNLNFSDSGTFGITAGTASIKFGGTNGFTAVPYAASYVGFSVKGAASQTADLQQWQNSAGVVLARVSATGRLAFGATGREQIYQKAAGQIGISVRTDGAENGYIEDGGQGAGAGLSFRSNSHAGFFTPSGFALFTNNLIVDGNHAAVSVIRATAAVAQTADLQQWRNSAAAVLFGITAAGLPRWIAAANQQTTVGVAGAAAALPATPSQYLKVQDSAGTTLVIPAYAAS